MSMVEGFTCSRSRPDPDLLMALRRGAQRTYGDRGPWLATSDLLALWQDRKPDIEYVAQYSGARPSAIREGLT